MCPSGGWVVARHQLPPRFDPRASSPGCLTFERSRPWLRPRGLRADRSHPPTRRHRPSKSITFNTRPARSGFASGCCWAARTGVVCGGDRGNIPAERGRVTWVCSEPQRSARWAVSERLWIGDLSREVGNLAGPSGKSPSSPPSGRSPRQCNPPSASAARPRRSTTTQSQHPPSASSPLVRPIGRLRMAQSSLSESAS